jgi:cell wall-associated NlpC family hydrolase
MEAISQSQQQTLLNYAAARRAQQAAQAKARAILGQERSATAQALKQKQTIAHDAQQAQQLLSSMRAKEAAMVRAAKARAARIAAERRAAALAAEQRRAAQAAQSFARQPVTPAPAVHSAPSAPSAPAPTVHHYSGSAVQIAIAAAKAQLGKPYVFGAAGPNSFDCSGLTMYAYEQAGIALPHYTNAQYAVGRHVSESQLEPGDLVFFNTDAPLGHVGMYLGGGEFIQAPHTGTVVQITALSGYYQQVYAGAVRVVG